MKWIVYGAYRRDTPAVPLTLEAPNASYAKKLFQRRNPHMHIVRIEKAAAAGMAQKEDWYGRNRRPRYRKEEEHEEV